ncbi:MAG: hypothetical protein CBC50_05585 [Synechococcus sp. TMED90]|nr:MAG: hypothetical protein CBC50_05585 [Synechococcus sp. TMED90]
MADGATTTPHPLKARLGGRNLYLIGMMGSGKSSTGRPLAIDRLGDGPVLLQLFLRGNPFQANRSVREPWADAIQQLIDLNRLFGLTVYGSPYVWEALSALLPRSIPAAYSPGQMPEAQQQLLNRMLGLKGEAHERRDFTD